MDPEDEIPLKELGRALLVDDTSGREAIFPLYRALIRRRGSALSVGGDRREGVLGSCSSESLAASRERTRSKTSWGIAPEDLKQKRISCQLGRCPPEK